MPQHTYTYTLLKECCYMWPRSPPNVVLGAFTSVLREVHLRSDHPRRMLMPGLNMAIVEHLADKEADIFKELMETKTGLKGEWIFYSFHSSYNNFTRQ